MELLGETPLEFKRDNRNDHVGECAEQGTHLLVSAAQAGSYLRSHFTSCTRGAGKGIAIIQNLGFRIGIFRCSKWLGIGWWDGDVPDGGGQVCDD